MNIELSHNRTSLNTVTKSFYNCVFNSLTFSCEGKSKLILNNNIINVITTNSEFIRLKNIKLNLFHHTNLDNTENDFGFDNVIIDFDNNLLQKISSNDYIGYENTFKKLLENSGLYSERKNISIYLSYFSSRKPKFKRLLFVFNYGYSRIEFPLWVTLVLIFIKYVTLHFNQHLFIDGNNSFIPVIYPIEMFKDIIFSDFTFKYPCVKIWLLLIEPIYIYSMFSLLTGIKRFLGFKLEI